MRLKASKPNVSTRTLRLTGRVCDYNLTAIPAAEAYTVGETPQTQLLSKYYKITPDSNDTKCMGRPVQYSLWKDLEATVPYTDAVFSLDG